MQSKENQEQQELQSVENSLIALRKLQIIDSKIDKIRTIRGELPLEVRDLEAACEGIETRIHKIEEVIKEFQAKITERETISKNANTAISKYKEQLDNVRNNREYDALNKEIEYQTLEIELSNKKIDDFKRSIEAKNEEIATCNAFKRIRNNMRNGLAVVKIERDACGGCFSKISPQRQLDICMHKKIIVCEFCGRILIDTRIADIANQEMQEIDE